MENMLQNLTQGGDTTKYEHQDLWVPITRAYGVQAATRRIRFEWVPSHLRRVDVDCGAIGYIAFMLNQGADRLATLAAARRRVPPVIHSKTQARKVVAAALHVMIMDVYEARRSAEVLPTRRRIDPPPDWDEDDPEPAFGAEGHALGLDDYDADESDPLGWDFSMNNEEDP